MLVAPWFAASAAAQTDAALSNQPDEELRADSTGLWMIGLLAQADDASSSGSVFSFGYGAGRSTWLSGLLAHSSSPSQRANISADTIVLGIDHRFERIGVNFEVEDWGESGAVESRDFEAAVYFHNRRLTAEFGLEQRDIDITFALPVGERVFTRKVPLRADGVAIALQARASERMRVWFDYRAYDYSRDLTVLPRIQQFSRLNGSALTLANSFIDARHMLGADITLGEKLLSLMWSQDTSAVDGSDLSSVGFSLLLPVALRFELEFSLGHSDSDFFESSTYGGVGILIFGG